MRYFNKSRHDLIHQIDTNRIQVKKDGEGVGGVLGGTDEYQHFTSDSQI